MAPPDALKRWVRPDWDAMVAVWLEPVVDQASASTARSPVVPPVGETLGVVLLPVPETEPLHGVVWSVPVVDTDPALPYAAAENVIWTVAVPEVGLIRRQISHLSPAAARVLWTTLVSETPPYVTLETLPLLFQKPVDTTSTRSDPEPTVWLQETVDEAEK